MKRVLSLFGSFILIGAAIQLAGPVAGASAVSTITLPGGNWDVTTTVSSKSAGHDLAYGISSPTSSQVCPTGAATTCAGGESDTFSALSGDLVFFMTDLTCSQTFQSTNAAHASIDKTDATHWQISWDDAGAPCGSPDGDLNDLVTSVEANGADMQMTSKGVTTTSEPSNTVFANADEGQNTAEYTIAITNNGPIDAQNVEVTDHLPQIGLDPAFSSADFCVGTDETDCTTNGFNAYPGTDELPVGTVETGTSRVLIIRAHANADLRGGAHTGVTNTATVSSSTGDPTTGNESATSDAIEIDTVADPPTIVQQAVGGNATASLEFSNDGEVDGGQGITSYDVFACKTANPAVCVAQTPAGPTPNATLNGQPVFSYIATNLNNGTEYSFSVVADNAVGSGDPVEAGDAFASAAAFTATNETGTLIAEQVLVLRPEHRRRLQPRRRAADESAPVPGDPVVRSQRHR